MLKSICSLYRDRVHDPQTEAPRPSSGMPMLCSQLEVGLNVIAGRPAMGSTTMAASLATELALAGKHVLYLAFPSQRADEKLCHQIAFHFKVPTGQEAHEEDMELDSKLESMSKVTLWFENLCYCSGYSYLRAKLVEYVKTYLIQYIFIDCIQEITTDKVLGDVGAVDYVCSELRTLSYELNVPIIATSKLNRNPEFRRGVDGKMPQLSDFRGGEVEQYARLVYFPYRPEYYNINVDEFGNSTDKVVNVIIPKNESGHLGEERLMFDRRFLRFYSKQTFPEFLKNPNESSTSTDDTDNKDLPF